MIHKFSWTLREKIGDQVKQNLVSQLNQLSDQDNLYINREIVSSEKIYFKHTQNTSFSQAKLFRYSFFEVSVSRVFIVVILHRFCFEGSETVSSWYPRIQKCIETISYYR